jgi:hypothetical protein
MNFEWDSNKAARNLIKHGVDFRDAARIFASATVEITDGRRDYGEVRVLSIGRFGEEILTVVNTVRGDNRRIISARRANEKEKGKYRQIRES